MADSNDKNFVDTTIERKVKANAQKNYVERLTSLKESGVDSALCKGCLHFYMATQDGLHWPKCKLGYDVQVHLAEKQGRLKSLSPDEIQIYKFSRDPVRWAQLFLDYTPRWYQEELLQCSAQKVVVRAGRRIGKTDALVVRVLHSMFTKPGKDSNENYKVLVICPYERQVNLIFDRLRELISRSALLKDSILRDISNPQRIEFNNGSIVEGIPAGVRTGAKADQVRGKDADLIALDEADYLDEGSIESIMAIFASHEDCRLWASSTITGNRSFFYQWCTVKRLGFKEFVYPASVNPNWTAETELFYKQTYSEAAYKREFDVIFSEADDGVFQHKYIDKSMADYSYADCFRHPKNLYVMGVDWNSTGRGTHIIINEYDLVTNQFKVVLKEVVDGSEFTQHLAISRIIDLDQKWNCHFIYVDAGYGATQIETIKQYGMRNQLTGLAQKIKSVDFGSKTEIRDPYTGKMIKKATKPLVVELSARRMESYQCILPKAESVAGGLIDQMRGFKVKRYGRDGQPVYTDDADHTLVAWMLSIFGLIYEYSDLTKFSAVTAVRFLSNNGAVDTNLDERGRVKPKTREEKELKTPIPRWIDPKSDSTHRTAGDVIGMDVHKRIEHRRRWEGGSDGPRGQLPKGKRKKF